MNWRRTARRVVVWGACGVCIVAGCATGIALSAANVNAVEPNAESSSSPTADALAKRLDAVRQETTPDLRLDAFDVKLDADAKTAAIDTTSEAARAAISLVAKDFPDWRISVRLLPEENDELGGKYFGLTNFSTIQLQKEPDHAAEWGTQSLMGQPVRILRKAPDGWILVQNRDGYLGFTTAGSVRASTREEFNAWVDAPKAIWLESFGFVYSEPDVDSPVVSDLTAGNVLRRFDDETTSDFWRVATPDGRTGWIRKSGAQDWDDWLATRKFDAESLIETAKRFVGTPYVWGGSSAKGVDCSGLVSLVFYLNGYDVLRDVSQLRREGIDVDLSNGWKSLQPGDLLIFGRKRADGSASWRHVAIYAGDGRFIHSATSVHWSSLDPASPEYDEGNARELIKAVRYIGAPTTEHFRSISESPYYRKR